MQPAHDTPHHWGILFVLVGPTGAGKNALMNVVLQQVSRLRQLPTATTRDKRSYEEQGREHLFVSREEFEQMIEEDALVEWQPVHHNHLYGTPRATLEKAFAAEDDLIADIDVKGAEQLHNTYPDNTILIFIQPPSVDELTKRIQGRGEETQAEIEERLRRVPMEMAFAPQCDYLITNDNKDAASATLHAIVLAEFSRRDMKKLRAASRVMEN